MPLVEPVDLWERSIDPAYKDHAPKGLSRHPRDLGVPVAGHTFPAENRSDTHAMTPIMTRQRDTDAESEALGWDRASQVKAMDTEGIDLAVLFPSRGLFTLGTGDLEPGLATAISRAYNDWLAECCAGGAGRLFGAGMIAPHDIDGAIHEARRVVNELGYKTVFVRPNLVHGRN
jgi:predicted TIM-barrel fold metal-dependent hydrolase